ncbi:hypothetical protein LUZ60_000829 [Juncus effusus]|nr:hypothetical protein LUZ60_000829 [Juncus effusus]
MNEPSVEQGNKSHSTDSSKKQRPSPLGWLREHKIRELLRSKRRLVEVPYSATLSQTVNALQANGVSALPVAAPPGHWIGAGGSMILESDPVTGAVRKHYIGMVMMLDVLVHLAESDEGENEGKEMDLDKLMAVPVSSVIGHSLEGLSLWTLNPNTSILDCMETFSKGVHRALVPLESQVDNSAPVELVEASPGYKMLTQMDVLRFLQSSSSELKDILVSSVEELGAINENVFAVTESAKVIETIKSMRATALTAVPVVESTGNEEILQDGRGKRLVETFSVTDLRECSISQLQSWLGLTVTEFKDKVAAFHASLTPEGGINTSEIEKSKKLVMCYFESNLEDVIEMAVGKHVHRVWVVDRQGMLRGVVSLTDVLHVVRESALKTDKDMLEILC